MQKEDREFLFVYGTLKSDMNNDMYHLLAKNARFIDDAVWNGKLYQVEDYPGAVPSNNPIDKVYGELYTLNNPERILPALDKYEECSDKFPEPTLFKRIRGDVKTLSDKGKIVKTWIYIYNLPIDNLEQIKSGNFTPAKK